jgi:hypothetical protein
MPVIILLCGNHCVILFSKAFPQSNHVYCAVYQWNACLARQHKQEAKGYIDHPIVIDNSIISLKTFLCSWHEVGSSNAMELEGAKRSFNFLNESGLKMDIFISDWHKGIAKWIKTKQKGTKHYNDIWHVNKNKQATEESEQRERMW